jgi:HicA toxin of bacterial toxin-antitoxin,
MPKGKRLPSKLPQRKVVAALEHMGYYFHHEGDEHTLYGLRGRPDVVASIPRHKEIALALVLREIKKAGFDKEDFVQAYSE